MNFNDFLKQQTYPEKLIEAVGDMDLPTYWASCQNRVTKTFPIAVKRCRPCFWNKYDRLFLFKKSAYLCVSTANASNDIIKNYWPCNRNTAATRTRCPPNARCSVWRLFFVTVLVSVRGGGELCKK